MIAATLTVLLIVFGLGGSGVAYSLFDMIDEASDAVDEIVIDRDRAEELLLITKEMELEGLRVQKDLREIRQGIFALDLDPGTTREQYRTAFRAADARQSAAEDILLDKVLEMRRPMSAEEWRALYAEMKEELE